MFVTRLEVTHKKPIYKKRKLFVKKSYSPDLTEEALANADAFIKTVNELDTISQAAGYPKISAAIVEPILAEFIRQNPPGYNQALNYDRPHLFSAKQCKLAEQIQVAAFPSTDATDPNIWSLFFNDVNNEKSYGVNERIFIVFDSRSQLVRINPLLPLCKPKKLKKLLKKLGYEYSRPGKGSHEIWQNKNGKNFPVPVHQGKDMKPGTVESILELATGRNYSNTEIKKLLNELG